MTDLPGRIVAARAIASSTWSEAKTAQPPDRLTSLVRPFAVHPRGPQIRRCFDLVCRDSLQADADSSSLNADGTPVQFALSLAEARTPAFEFVGEPFGAAMDYDARRAFGFERMFAVASILGLASPLQTALPALEALAHNGPASDGEDPSGAFWLGASFEPSGVSMTVYANARRGPEATRPPRLAAFAGSLAPADWPRLFTLIGASPLKPLGAGVRVRAHGPAHVRVYFGAYGILPREYRRIFQQAGAGDAFDRELAVFFEEMLREESAFPTRSAVISFGSEGDGNWSPKLELCAHCAWNSDREAEKRCGAWLPRLGVDPGIYREVVAALPVHAWTGVGMRHARPYASIYFNPGREGL